MNKLVISIILPVFITTIVVGGIVYFSVKISNEEEKSQLLQEIENLNNQINILSQKDSADTSNGQTYRNEEYGFEITLLDSWQGFSVLAETWSGSQIDDPSIKYQGPKIIIRHPNWSKENVWQDVPIMVITKDEWQLIEDENLNISAAPIGPSKLGENNNYVFALPPRWIGFTDALGQQEAKDITETFVVL